MRTVVTRQGETVDMLAQAAYGRTAGAAEAVLDANPDLAGRPARLPAGLTVRLPELAAEAARPTVRLWD